MVQPDELGVRITPRLRGGIRVTELQPGIYLWWPLIQLIETIQAKVQVVDLRSQSVMSLDKKEMVISGAIRYRVKSAKKALYEVTSYDENIQTIALGIIQRHVQKHRSDRLDTNQIEREVLEEVRKASEGWGLRIERVYVTDIGRTRNIRLLMNEHLPTAIGS